MMASLHVVKEVSFPVPVLSFPNEIPSTPSNILPRNPSTLLNFPAGTFELSMRWCAKSRI